MTPPRLPILVSFAYIASPAAEKTIARLIEDPRVDLMIDSGAFTAKFSAKAGSHVTLDSYCSFLERVGGGADAYIALDVVSEPEATMENLKRMAARGLTPLPVHVIGAPLEIFDELYSYHDWVCCAGMQKRNGVKEQSYVAWKMGGVAGRKTHWLGNVRPELLMRWLPHSCDSSSWTAGARYGWMYLYHGNGRLKMYRLYHSLHRKALYLDQDFKAACAEYGYDDTNTLLDPKEWGLGAPGSKGMVQRVSTISYIRYVLDLYQKYGIRQYLATGLNPTTLLLDTYDEVVERYFSDKSTE